MAVANWGGNYLALFVGRSTIDDLTDVSLYNFNAPFEPTAETPIPLFGVKLYNPIQLGADGVGQGGTLHLLRAMAKIEVECSSTYSTLESATLTRYNLSGYMAPKGVYAQ